MGRRSAARLEGDRYQHLYSWYVILELLDPTKRIDHVWLERAQVGAADDVTVHPESSSDQVARYYQVKWHVDYSLGYSMASLIDPGDSATSLLQKLWAGWNRLRNTEGEVEVWLVSNWSPLAGDPLGELIRARECRLDDDFLTAGSRSGLGKWRREWQDHLGADDESFSAFVQSLHFRLGFPSVADLEEMVDDRMRLFGLQFGPGPRSIATDHVRALIEKGGVAKRIDRDVLDRILRQLNLYAREGEEGIVVVVHTWSARAYDLAPDYEIDWTSHFNHTTRRVPSSDTWNQVLLPQLRELERTISRQDSRRYIQLRANLSLSAAFAVGHVFSEAGGYRLEIQHREQLWQSNTPPDDTTQLDLTEETSEDNGTDLLVIFSVTGEARQEAIEFAKAQGLPIRATLHMMPAGGPHDFSVRDASHACALARKARQELRRARQQYGARTIHLFYFGPQSLAVLLGRKLNACGPIQLYEYQNSGYVASCLLR